MALLSIYGIHRYLMIGWYCRHRKETPRPANYFEILPEVTVQLPLYREPKEVVDRLLEAICAIDYPKELLQIQVLDDSNDISTDIAGMKVRDKVAEGYRIEHLCRTDRTGYKAGALEEALKTAEGELIAIFDADFVPAPDLLQRTVHYFTDPSIGMIQTRWGHLNENYSLLTRLQGMLLDGHLLIEQTARYRAGRFFTFNGSAGLWRRRTIEDAGGWEHDTLTEDLDLSYRAQLKGWKFIFLGNVVTPSELPIEINAFKVQQHRWTKGAIQTCKKILPRLWKSSLPLKIKLEGTFHLTANFTYLALILLCAIVQPLNLVHNESWEKSLAMNAFIFSVTTLSMSLFYIYAQREIHPRTWRRRLLYLPLLMVFGVGMSINNTKAVIEALFNHESEFIRTPKHGLSTSSAGRRVSHAKTTFLMPSLEICLGLYYSYLTWGCIMRQDWMTATFLGLFQAGFLYVGLMSIFQWVGSPCVPVRSCEPVVHLS